MWEWLISANWSAVGQTAAALVTASATIALVFATVVLARETRNMADRAARPHVVVTIESNQWAINHADVRVANTGNAAAYDIQITFEPQLPHFRDTRSTPFQTISVLRPGQEMISHIDKFSKLSDKYVVAIDWRRAPKEGKRESLNYELNIDELENIARLGASTPLIQIASEIKKMREDMHGVLRGMRRLSVDSYSEADRAQEQEERDAWFDKLEKSEKGSDDEST